MDAGMLTSSKKDNALYVFYANKAATQKEQPDVQTAEVVLDINKGRLNQTAPLTPTDFALDELIVQILLDQLTYTATKNLGPTKSSRVNYIFMFTVAAAYNWLLPLLSGTKDDWNWNTHVGTSSALDTYVFVNHALIAVLPTLIPNYNVAPLLVDEQARMGWTPSQQTAYVNNLQTAKQFSTWLSNWQIWYAGRVADGNVAASVPPSAADLVTYGNSTIFLNVNARQTVAEYPKPGAWTPLVIQDKTFQKYMTWNWDNVTSTCLSPADEVNIQAAADAYFPTSTRDADIDNLVSTVTNLQDAEKIQAEFWSGGPYTASPPGIYLYLWAMTAKGSGFAKTMGMKTFFLSGLQLAVSLFEAGRVTWRVKKSHFEARPIQEIRNRYYSSTIAAYDGTLVQGSLWVPFQTKSFVTPPFADFSSGHSAFGQVFLNIMTSLFGPDIPQTEPIKLTKMYLLSPIFTVDQTQPFGVFLFPQGASQIQPGIVPSTDTFLHYTTWQEIATSCGLSRQYGGIHAMSAHLGSVALANTLTPIVNTAWGFI